MTRSKRAVAIGGSAAALLLLLASAGNFGSLCYAQRSSLNRPIEIRKALGATPQQLVRSLVVEIVVVTSALAIMALSLASAVLGAIQWLMPLSDRPIGSLGLDWRSVAFCFASASAVVSAGLGGSRIGLILNSTPSRRTHMPQSQWIRLLSVAGQSAIATLLLAGSGLLVASHVNLLRQSPGIARDVAVFELSVPMAVTPEAVALVNDEISQIVRAARSAIPGAVIAITDAPIVDDGLSTTTIIIKSQRVSINTKAISPEYFSVTLTPLIAGRAPRGYRAPVEVAVSRSAAKQWWPASSAIGQPVILDGLQYSEGLVVGVVDDVIDQALDKAPVPTVYTPFLPSAPIRFPRLLVRSPEDSQRVTSLVESVVYRVDPRIVVVRGGTVDQRLATGIEGRSFVTFMLGGYSVAAVVVSLVGVFSVVSYVVSQRTSEIAIRMALGARHVDIWRLVTGQAMMAVSVGALVGAIVGQTVCRAAASWAYGIEPGGWTRIILGTSLFAVAATTAATSASRRATRIAPARALVGDERLR